MSWQPELDELRARERFARELGGADKVKRQHDDGRLTVRERIDGLVDPTSFHEIGAIAGNGEYDENGELHGAGAGELRVRAGADRRPDRSWWSATISPCAAARPTRRSGESR